MVSDSEKRSLLALVYAHHERELMRLEPASRKSCYTNRWPKTRVHSGGSQGHISIALNEVYPDSL